MEKLNIQGEPVAWRVTGPSGVIGCYVHKPHEWAHGYKIEPLYAHADPSDIRVTRQALESLKGEANDLRVQIAERDALLSSAYSEMERTNNWVGQCISCGEPPEDDGIITHDPACTFCAMEIATYASEESSAMADIGERADILADAAYRNGVMHGYKLAMEGSEAEYQACINSLTGHLHAARAAMERKPS